jgi:hypothetical protein
MSRSRDANGFSVSEACLTTGAADALAVARARSAIETTDEAGI